MLGVMVGVIVEEGFNSWLVGKCGVGCLAPELSVCKRVFEFLVDFGHQFQDWWGFIVVLVAFVVGG